MGKGGGGEVVYGLEARVPLRDVAHRLGRKAATLRKWYSAPDLNRRFNASSLLRRDQSGRLFSTDRLMLEWEASWINERKD